MSELRGPLSGLKVLDLSIIVAGGTASSLMADFGAEVVKIEKPKTGDPLRNWGPFYKDISLWWKVHSRNKKSVTLNLSDPEGQKILRMLSREADILIEGFRPGTMEQWELGPDQLLSENPNLIMVRYSGFGQTGPYKDRPGFGTIAECMSGYISMTGFSNTPPVLPPIPLADEIAGVFGAMASMMAIYHKQRNSHEPAGSFGQVIDVSLFEPLFRLCIPHITMYDLMDLVRERVGNDFPDAAPRSLYATKDNQWLGLSATSQNTWENLAKAMGMPHIIDDPRFQDNASRLNNKDELNEILQDYMNNHDLSEIMEELVPAGGVVGPVYNSKQIMDDPHFAAREDIIELEDSELGKTKMLGVVPKFSATPGSVVHAGPKIGQDNDDVYKSWLGMTDTQISKLQSDEII
jgi:crotonobetainyl-CoA:carnitine CoA-transferase CaiB-like acyl-CoA transferase